MDYMTIKETAAKWEVSDKRVLQYCNMGRIIGAERWGILGLSRKALKNQMIEDTRTMWVKLQNKRRARFSE
ncbi:hypothetical protein C806_02663 [Lachnospiraceae bacterium 3-1]|nr:hypothetical protein C806_02663 [Lachnospiraceae bacterium 3-1]